MPCSYIFGLVSKQHEQHEQKIEVQQCLQASSRPSSLTIVHKSQHYPPPPTQHMHKLARVWTAPHLHRKQARTKAKRPIPTTNKTA